MKDSYKYIFGPVPSRRLGYSLGVDLVPFKTCSFDCIYCQLGKTTLKTAERKEFVSSAEIVDELKIKLNENIAIDYITLSGSGEPTLYSDLGGLIKEIRKMTNKPLAVLTNGSILWDKAVVKGLQDADLVIPSLDAGSRDVYQQVNRPCKGLGFEKVVKGIIDFSAEFRNKIWLEVFLVNGINTNPKAVGDINSIIKIINPAKIQLNTVKRPPLESFALSVPEKDMLELAKYFDGNVEIIADYKCAIDTKHMKTSRMVILNLLKRRPCSLNDIAGGLNLHKNEIVKYLEELKKNNKIDCTEHNQTIYYAAK
jgi:wyosine [tRNA(Phe)-imidazoG37] synthetase (radical SAM superfamily)